MANYFMTIFFLFPFLMTGAIAFGDQADFKEKSNLHTLKLAQSATVKQQNKNGSSLNQEKDTKKTIQSPFIKTEHQFVFKLSEKNNSEEELSLFKEKNFIFSGKLKINPYVVKRGDKNDNVLDTRLYGQVYWKLSESLFIYHEALLLGRHGSIQSVYPREYKKPGYNPLEFFLEYDYSSHLEFKFGSLKQSFLSAPLLITDKTFPGFRETISFSLLEEVTSQLLFQQTIPHNIDDGTEYFSQLTYTPFFFTGSLFLETKPLPKLFNSIIEDKLTAFYFTPLPPAVAKIGEIEGNSIAGYGSAVELNFQFVGIHNNIHWQFPIKDSWVIELGWDYLHNFGAPSAYNKGGRFYASVYYDLFGLMELKATGELFGNQSDSSVAFYNDWKYGHNNRQGVGVEFQGHFYQSGLTIGARYMQTRPIEMGRTSLGEGHYISIYIETGYLTI